MPRTSYRPLRRRVIRALCALVVGIESLLLAGPGLVNAATPEETIPLAAVSPAVFEPNGDAVADPTDATILTYQLARPATVDITVVDYAGTRVRRLQPATAQAPGAYSVTWDGLSDAASPAPDGGYRFRITANGDLGKVMVERPVTKAPIPVYPIAPGTITVALDPGHGGRDPGTNSGTLLEKTVNLDIALRLRAMLVGAGVNVVMTRTQDQRVNLQGIDWTADGQMNDQDELASRIEVANAAAADVFIDIHNNGIVASRVSGTETWFTVDRPWATENRLLATSVQASVMSRLRMLSVPGFKPVDRGIRRIQFYVNGPYHQKLRPRPSLMPTIVGESLFMTNPGDRAALRSPLGRQAIAQGYYQALAIYFASRTDGAKYALVTAPPPSLMEGQPALAQVRVTNNSPVPWPAGSAALTVNAVPAVRYYDGSSQAGMMLGSVPLPTDVAPGASVVVDLPFTAPAFAAFASRAGATLLKFDLADAGGRFELQGVVPLQVPFVVTPNPALVPPTPTPTTTPIPTPTPTPTPTPDPSTPPVPSP